MRLYSIIIPVYNGPDKLDGLLSSLCEQTYVHFEVIVVENDSTIPAKEIVRRYQEWLDLHYYVISNSGPDMARDHGARQAHGEYLLILDSDVVLPSTWLEHIHDSLNHYPVDAFGGPDKAHASFSPIQKAINYAMTSFLTTDGIRGGKEKLDKFYPRSFSMGIRRDVYERLGGFSGMRYGEDIDFSIRIMETGYRTRLFPSAWVYHKRRTDLMQFFRQVRHSREARIALNRKHPGSLKLVHCLPALFTFSVCLLVISSFFCRLFLVPLIIYALLLFVDAMFRNKCDLRVGSLSVIASFTQLFGYGTRFLRSIIWMFIYLCFRTTYMKTTGLFSFLILISLVSNANAQLRVLSNERIQAGLLKDNNEDLENVTSMQIYGRIEDARAGSKLAFGDFGQYANQGWNVFAGEYGATDTDQLWLHGKLGIYMTTNGYANNVVAYYNPASSTNFVFNTNLRVSGVNITSDARLEENVESLQNPLALLEQVNGVSCSYNLSTLEGNREQDRSKFSATLDNGISGSSSDSEEVMDAATIAKINRDKQVQAEIDRREAAEASRKRIGFLTQDIQKVLPELVQTDENGMMSIDYIGFIPLIVESIKEMQQTIQQQNEVIDNLQALLSPEVQSQLRSNTTSTSNISAVDGAKLYNREGASVSYTLPATFVSASLQIFDITDKPVKVIELDNGSSSVVEVSRSELGYETFIYTLFVDGKKADTLKKYVSL